MYYLLRLATVVLPWVPVPLRVLLGQIIGIIAWSVAAGARRQAYNNMLHVLGHELEKTSAGRRKLKRIVRRMFQHNARNYLENCILSKYSKEQMQRIVTPIELEHIDAGLARGKGVILFTAHLGPFDYAVQQGSISGYDITVPVEPLKDQRLLDFMLQLRSAHGIHFLPLSNSSTLRQLLQKLKSNNVILLTTDRGSQGQLMPAVFFDTATDLPAGAATLAQRTGAALVGVFCWRTTLNKVQVQCVPVSSNLTEEQCKDAQLLEQKICEVMEQFIAAHPEQWLAFSSIWQEN